MSECTDSGFFPEPLFPVRVLLKADVLQTLVVAGPLVMQLFLWLAWELFATKRPKTRAVINASGLVAGLCVAVQIIFVQRCFQVFQCLDIFDELDRWTIGSITILGAVNSISVGVLSPRVPRVAAALLVFIGGGIALTEYVFRSNYFDVPEDKLIELRQAFAPAIAAQFVSYTMATCTLFRVEAARPDAPRRRSLWARSTRLMPSKGIVALQTDHLDLKRREALPVQAPSAPPVYCGF